MASESTSLESDPYFRHLQETDESRLFSDLADGPLTAQLGEADAAATSLQKITDAANAQREAADRLVMEARSRASVTDRDTRAKLKLGVLSLQEAAVSEYDAGKITAAHFVYVLSAFGVIGRGSYDDVVKPNFASASIQAQRLGKIEPGKPVVTGVFNIDHESKRFALHKNDAYDEISEGGIAVGQPLVTSTYTNSREHGPSFRATVELDGQEDVLDLSDSLVPEAGLIGIEEVNALRKAFTDKWYPRRKEEDWTDSIDILRELVILKSAGADNQRTAAIESAQFSILLPLIVQDISAIEDEPAYLYELSPSKFDGIYDEIAKRFLTFTSYDPFDGDLISTLVDAEYPHLSRGRRDTVERSQARQSIIKKIATAISNS